MKLNQIEIKGFGKIVNQSYEFGPSMNLIYGFNEAGKSTLQRSILTALYGFFDQGSITANKKSILTSYEPWDSNAPYGLRLFFDVDNGSKYMVDRTFSPKAETILYDLNTRRSLNSKYISSSQGRLFFAEELLGMPREVFENTCMVRQAELAALENSASSITDALLRLSASGSQESTTSQALEFLELAYKEQIGTHRSRNKPLPEAQRRLESLQKSRTLLQSEHQALANEIHELAQVEEHFNSLIRERDKAEYQRLSAQLHTVQQQRLNLEQADSEVARCQKDVDLFQTWSSFPTDAQPKVQRLTAQHEKIYSDLQQAKHQAESAIQRVGDLHIQFKSFLKSLNSTSVLSDLPDFQNLHASNVNNEFQTWLDEQFSILANGIQKQQQEFDSRTKNLLGKYQFGHDDLSKDRQELGNLEHEYTAAEQAVQQAIEGASQEDLPLDQWESILSNEETKIATWNKWSKFPIDLRDALLQLKAQYTPLNQTLVTKSEKTLGLVDELTQLKGKITSLKQQVSKLEKVRNIPHLQRPRIQEIFIQLNAAKQAFDDAHQQFEAVDDEYLIAQPAFDLEKGNLKHLNQLGIAGITTLQQRWLNLTNQLVAAHTRLKQSKETWKQVGMSITEFDQLENKVAEINHGNLTETKPRRGCSALLVRPWYFIRSIFSPKLKGNFDQTPMEISIYSQIQPKYADFVRQSEEISTNDRALRQVEIEMKEFLGDLAPEVITEDTFNNLLQRLQNYQQQSQYIEQQKNIWETRHNQLVSASNYLDGIRTRLESELGEFGLEDSAIEDRIQRFYKACDEKEELINVENSLERLQSQAAILNQQVEQHQLQQKSLTNVETEILNLLLKANIEAKADTLPENIQEFELGEENYYKWREARIHQEHIQKRIAEIKDRLNKTRSTVEAKKERLADFRRRLIDKYSGLLPMDFSTKNLDYLNAELQFQKETKAELEKLQGQLERFRFQAQTIRTDLANWVEKENLTKHIENEILQTVSGAGVQADRLPLADALLSFEKAYDGYSNWQKSRQALNAALQAQLAVRTSLPKLDHEIMSIETKIAGITKQHSEWKNITVSEKSEFFEQNLKKLDDQILQERDHLSRLQDSVNRGTKDLRHLAEIDEELALANSAVAQFTNFGQILEIAINVLTNATAEFQKMFAPRLERLVEDGVAQITNRRYQQVRIDPGSLSVSVISPERKEKVPTEQLSTGTRDLIYLMLRIGIAQLMSNSGENLPLLLDDPLVEFDVVRQRNAIKYFMEVSKKTQLLFFTKDESFVQFVSQNYDADAELKVIHL